MVAADVNAHRSLARVRIISNISEVNHGNQCRPICHATHAGMGGRANLWVSRATESTGLLAGLRKNDESPRFIQARHEELAAFMASAHAKFTGTVGVCMATSGPGAIHLLNGLYDAKMDHQPVVAIVGQSATTAIGSQYQQEVDLQSLFKDVASEYCVTVRARPRCGIASIARFASRWIKRR